ncbi:UNVERIFIED_CONTAM: hypothetical protein FKN15_074449 [Acipenser sinensis]
MEHLFCCGRKEKRGEKLKKKGREWKRKEGIPKVGEEQQNKEGRGSGKKWNEGNRNLEELAREEKTVITEAQRIKKKEPKGEEKRKEEDKIDNEGETKGSFKEVEETKDKEQEEVIIEEVEQKKVRALV